MPKHLFAETIFTQPTCVIDLIQSYALWAEKNIDKRTERIVRVLNEEVVEYIEEYVIEDDNLSKDHMITVKTVIYPKNPSIVILETLGSRDIEDSKINMIINDYDETYLLLPEAIKITAGRNVVTDMPGNDQSDPSNPNSPSDPGYNDTIDHRTFDVNWTNAASDWQSIYVNSDFNRDNWNPIGSMNWDQLTTLDGGGYKYMIKNHDTNEILSFHTDGSLNDIIRMLKNVANSVPRYGEEMELYYPEGP